MDKQERKRIIKQIKEKEKANFNNSLPMNRTLFAKLFDYLDEQLETRPCKHNLDITVEFLRKMNIPEECVVDWLLENGAGCD
jgi:hypothetical protein